MYSVWGDVTRIETALKIASAQADTIVWRLMVLPPKSSDMVRFGISPCLQSKGQYITGKTCSRPGYIEGYSCRYIPY